jgi:hypothetical protein
MSRTSRNFVVAYILLVGLPLLGLAGVLRSGRSLTAPISVDGVWKFDADANSVSPQGCAKVASSLASTSAVISQSGKSLVLMFNGPSKIVASGSIEGKSLTAAINPEPDSLGAVCSGDQTVSFTATVDPKSEPRALTGVLSVNGCPSCAPIPFHAVRQPRVAAGGAH